MQKLRSGFTLIELIIGITILSLLAVALLAALDPVEQFNKARDTSSRNAAMEIHNAILRYNAANDDLPDLNPSIVNPSTVPTVIANLVLAGELKANFANAAGSSLNNIAIFSADDTANGVSTCYRPSSKQFSQAKNNYQLTAVEDTTAFLAPSAFPTGLGSTPCSQTQIDDNQCLWCAQ